MADIKLDPSTGDLDLSSGGLAIATNGDEARQRIELAISLNLGEFFSHLNYGLPWIKNPNLDIDGISNIRYFLGDHFPEPEAYIYAQLDKYLASLPLVSSVESSYTFDPSTREFKYTFNVTTVEGEDINFPPFISTI